MAVGKAVSVVTALGLGAFGISSCMHNPPAVPTIPHVSQVDPSVVKLPPPVPAQLQPAPKAPDWAAVKGPLGPMHVAKKHTVTHKKVTKPHIRPICRAPINLITK